MSYADEDRFYRKFIVFPAQGEPLPQLPDRPGVFMVSTAERAYFEPIEGPWFVLCYARDPHAYAALATYADSCETELPGLAADIRAELDRLDRQAAHPRP